MGQKIHPTGFRLSVSRNWASRWYASNRDFAGMLAEDIKVREYLKAKLKNAAVSRILIERPAKNARITIYSARPGVVIGKKGEDIENLKKELATRLGVPVAVNIEEVRKPEIDAKLIADSITQQLEKRIMFRRAMKRAMQNAMRLGAQGIKIMSAGRLNGIEIARTEWYREGRVPLHTLRADIDYGFIEAKTTYGIIGVKVWVFKGEVLEHDPMAQDKRWAQEASGPSSNEGRERGGPRGDRGQRRGREGEVMLQPKKTTYRKAFKGRIHGNAKGGTSLNFGSYGLKALEPERITARQIEAARRAISRAIKRQGRL